MARETANRRKNQTQKKKTGPLPIFAMLLFLGGAAVFWYPAVSNFFAERHQIKVIEKYQEDVANMNAEELKEEWRKAEEYNKSLSDELVHDPFEEGSGSDLPHNYTEVLNLAGDGVMGYLEIPRIAIKLPIYHGTDEEVLEKGVGHIESTSLPIGGEGQHAALTGHRGLPSAELFTRLDEMKEGDFFYIHVLDETLAYKVDQIKTILPTEFSEIQRVQGEDLVTLITCTPYGENTHRLLVRGHRTEYVPEEKEKIEAADFDFDGMDGRLRLMRLVLGGILLLMAVTLLILLCRKPKERRP